MYEMRLDNCPERWLILQLDHRTVLPVALLDFMSEKDSVLILGYINAAMAHDIR